MRAFVAGLVFGLVVGPAFGVCPAFGQSGPPHVMPREQTFRRSAMAGTELRVFTYARWHDDCSPDAVPQVVLRTKPAHGTVTVRPGNSTVANVRAGSPDCTGRTYQGTAVWYLPSPGFVGVDQFDWDVTDSKATSHDTAIVEVK